MNTEVIAIINNKGGVGKTTSVSGLGYSFGKKDKRVLLIDTDPQGNLTRAFGYEPKDKPQKSLYSALKASFDKTGEHPCSFVVTTSYPNIDLLSGDDRLATIRTELESRLQKFDFIYKTMIQQIIELSQYDIVLIDTSPSVGGENTQVLMSSNWVIIPTTTSRNSVEGIDQSIGFYQNCRNINTSLNLAGVLLNMVVPRSAVAKDIVPTIESIYGRDLFRTFIQRDAQVEQAEWNGIPVNEYNKNTRAAQEYLELAEEVLLKIGNKVE
jgi:chromosome partitioning protein